jgi:DNA-directed RNA polymerase subunit RPC12/RpoP
MIEYTYFCERCGATFEVEIDGDGAAVPPEAVCPKCEFPHAVKFYASGGAASAKTCAPDSGC